MNLLNNNIIAEKLKKSRKRTLVTGPCALILLMVLGHAAIGIAAGPCRMQPSGDGLIYDCKEANLDTGKWKRTFINNYVYCAAPTCHVEHTQEFKYKDKNDKLYNISASIVGSLEDGDVLSADGNYSCKYCVDNDCLNECSKVMQHKSTDTKKVGIFSIEIGWWGLISDIRRRD